jgi:hypothetical protein
MSNPALVFGVIAGFADVTLAAIVLAQGRQRGEDAIGWALLTLLLPFVGYALWRLWVNAGDNKGADHEDFVAFMGNGRRRGDESDH